MRRQLLDSRGVLALLVAGVSSQLTSIASTTAISSGTTLSTDPTAPSRQPTTFLRSTSASSTKPKSSTTSTENAVGPASDATTGANQSGMKSGLLNYYFAFLAVLIVMIMIGGWIVHRRHRRLKALRASSRQNALSRDLDGWTGGRRWAGGPFRGGLGRRSNREHSRDEGLNELGEAPPPYKPRDSVTEAVEERRTEAASEPAVPMRALGPEGRAVGKPPDYHDTVQEIPQPLQTQGQLAGSSSPSRVRAAFTRANTSEHMRTGSS